MPILNYAYGEWRFVGIVRSKFSYTHLPKFMSLFTRRSYDDEYDMMRTRTTDMN